MKIALSKIAERQLDRTHIGSKILSKDNLHDFLDLFNNGKITYTISQGNTPFSKIIEIDNSDKRLLVSIGHKKITNENYQWLRTKYVKRRENEISYLERYFDFPCETEIADKVTFVLFQKEHLVEHDEFEEDIDYGIISISSNKNVPLPPSIILRNHLGKMFGGSGEEIDIKEYEKSVEYWDKHAPIL